MYHTRNQIFTSILVGFFAHMPTSKLNYSVILLLLFELVKHTRYIRRALVEKKTIIVFEAHLNDKVCAYLAIELQEHRKQYLETVSRIEVSTSLFALMPSMRCKFLSKRNNQHFSPSSAIMEQIDIRKEASITAGLTSHGDYDRSICRSSLNSTNSKVHLRLLGSEALLPF